MEGEEKHRDPEEKVLCRQRQWKDVATSEGMAGSSRNWKAYRRSLP